MTRKEKAKLATAINMLAECLQVGWYDIVSLHIGINLSEEDAGIITKYMAENYDD